MCIGHWPPIPRGLCLFCCYQPSFVVSQQSWFWAFCFINFPINSHDHNSILTYPPHIIVAISIFTVDFGLSPFVSEIHQFFSPRPDPTSFCAATPRRATVCPGTSMRPASCYRLRMMASSACGTSEVPRRTPGTRGFSPLASPCFALQPALPSVYIIGKWTLCINSRVTCQLWKWAGGGGGGGWL